MAASATMIEVDHSVKTRTSGRARRAWPWMPNVIQTPVAAARIGAKPFVGAPKAPF